MRPAVSVITPVHNGAAFLREAVESVLSQTMPEWELLMVDDRSTDESREIAERYARQDPRVRSLTVSGRRTGAAAARNIGIDAARGKYVTFLDADDLFVPGKLAVELDLASKYPEVKLISGATHWWHPGNEAADWTDAVRHVAPGLYLPPVLLTELILLNRDQVPCVCAVMARRDAVRAVGGFEEELALYEDQSLWVKLYDRYPAYLGNHLTSVYRQHDRSTSTTAAAAGEYNRLRGHSSRDAFLAWTERYLRTDGRLTTDTWRALRLARALIRGDQAGLSVPDRLAYARLRTERLRRRAAARLRHWRPFSRLFVPERPVST